MLNALRQNSTRKPVFREAGIFTLTVLLALSLVLSACGTTTPQTGATQPAAATPQTTSTLGPGDPIDQAALFTGADAIPGWAASGGLRTYTRDNLFDLVDGQADSFFVYGYQQTTVKRYKNAQGVLLMAAVWQVDTPENAFGMFTLSRSGEAAEIGCEGDTDPGQRLAFWQNRYFVSIVANQKIADTDLWAFAKSIAAALPPGGERPPLVSRLPKEGLEARSDLFFHEELSIQSEVWLGGENLLGLSSQTDGVIGRYQLDGDLTRLLLVEYPEAGQASTALEKLKAAGVTDFLDAAANGNLLGAVFGEAAEPAARTLLERALGK